MNRLYFAYGSNLHPLRLTERAPSSTVVGPARLDAHGIRFHKRSRDGSAKCDIVADPGAAVHGALFHVDEHDLPSLAAAEEGYERVEVDVQSLNDQRTVAAFTYRARPERIAADLRPYRWYRDLVVLGARHHGLPADYTTALERVTVADDLDARRAAAMDALCRRLRSSCVAAPALSMSASMATPTAKPWTPAQERMGTLVIRYMSRANKWLYWLTGGWLGGTFYGAPVMFLTTVGRKSGEPRTVPLLCLAEGETLVTVASKGGMSHHPMWYRNLAANPAVEVQFQGRKRAMTAHTATPEEKRAWWPKLCAMYPDYADYQARTERDIPVVVLAPRAG